MKYELTNTIKDGLHQIRALKDFNDVRAGDLGGYIEGEYNLSQTGISTIKSNLHNESA